MTEATHDRVLRELREYADKFQRDPPAATPITCRCCGVETTWGAFRGEYLGQPTVMGPYAFLVRCPSTGIARKVHCPACPCGRCARASQQRSALMEKGWDGTGKTPALKPRLKWDGGTPTEWDAYVYMKCSVIRPSDGYERQFAQRARRLAAAGYTGPVEWDQTLEQARDAWVAHMAANPDGRHY